MVMLMDIIYFKLGMGFEVSIRSIGKIVFLILKVKVLE